MGTGKWDKVIKYLNSKPKAMPDRVLNSLKTIYGARDTGQSEYQILRASWTIDVVCNIYNKKGTTDKNKKQPLKQVIRNYCKSDDYSEYYKIFHQGRMFKDLPLEKHVRNCNDIYISKHGKDLRKVLEMNNGKLPAIFKNTIEFKYWLK